MVFNLWAMIIMVFFPWKLFTASITAASVSLSSFRRREVDHSGRAFGAFARSGGGNHLRRGEYFQKL